MRPLQHTIISWIENHRGEALILIGILFIGAFMRLYRIDEYMTFLGDEGRDAIIVRNLLVNADPILIGPGTSIGNMYLGPLYYYLIAPFLFLANFSPVGPSVMVALFGVATIFLVWLTAREWFGSIAGIVASLLYAVAPVVITYNRSSWNPNIMPFFSLLCIYAVWRIWKKHEFIWLPVLGISYAFVLQSHYLGLLLGPVLALYLVVTSLSLRTKKQDLRSSQKYFWKYAFLGLALFLLLMSPLVIFDARHGWMNFSAIEKFFTERQTTVSVKPWNAFPKFLPLWEKITSRLLGGTSLIAGYYVSITLLLGTILLVIRKIKDFKSFLSSPYLLLFLWLTLALLGLGNYKQEIYDHYYGFFFTAPFLLLGGLIQYVYEVVSEKNSTIRTLVYTFLAIDLFALLGINILNSPLRYPPNRQLQRSEIVSNKIIEESGGRKLNFAVIAERNYEGAYQYFLEKERSGFVKIDPLNTADTIADQLFVVCELPKEKCDPTRNPKAEVANFGWSQIEKEWDIEGVTLYKLGHLQNE